MIRTIILLVVFYIIPLNAFSTTQAPEKIIYKGKEYMLYTCPLENYCNKYPEKRLDTELLSTGVHRGYIGVYEVINNELILKEIMLLDPKGKRSESEYFYYRNALKEVFPNSKKVKVDWFDGFLILPYGEIEQLHAVGTPPEYSNYILLEIEKGNLINEMRFTREQYNKFKQTNKVYSEYNPWWLE